MVETQTPPTQVMSVAEAAQYLGVSRLTILRHLEEVPHQRIGRRILFHRDALDAWLIGQGRAPLAEQERP